MGYAEFLTLLWHCKNNYRNLADADSSPTVAGADAGFAGPPRFQFPRRA